MKKGTKILLVIVIILAICGGVTFWGYTQLKSGLSILGGMKVADLGVVWSAEDALNFQEKIGTSATTMTVEECSKTGATCVPGTTSYSGTQTIDTTMTNAEGTALINEWIKLSPNAPFTSAQMRVNNDGTVDFSGLVDMNRVKNYARVSGVPQETIDLVSKYVGVLGTSFPINASGRLTIKNNQVDANFNSVKVGFIQVPADILTSNKSTVDSFVEDRFKVVKGMSIEELSFENGKTTFKGTMPKEIEFIK